MVKEALGTAAKPGRPLRFEGTRPKDEVIVVLKARGTHQGVVLLGMDNVTACAICSKMMMDLTVPHLDEMAQVALLEFVRIYTLKARMVLADKGQQTTVDVPEDIKSWASAPALGARTLMAPVAAEGIGTVHLYLDLAG